MALEEIERLKDKIEKDPFSKLFVPLAEEYKKAGMYDEAIDVLAKGLEKQPGYLSARVSLGKIYIERGLPDKARSEFEKVIEAIPDNLYAHKKLAEIYKDLGEKDNAVKEFKTVLRLNPADEWAATTLAEIEEKPEKAVPKGAEEIIAEPPLAEEKVVEEMQGVKPPDITPGGEETGLSELRTEIAEHVETAKAPEAAASQRETELWEQQAGTFREIEEEKPSGTSISEEDMRLWKARTGITEETETTKEEAAAEPGELPEENSFSFENVFRRPQAAVEETQEIAEEVSEQPLITAADADRYISQEKYSDAMNVYRNLLSAEPGNKQILQRVEELRALLKMLGKDKEQLISRLDSFLGGVRKRRNEFFGSP
jgi:tetratricopeptide (TPR) repeat protein